MLLRRVHHALICLALLTAQAPRAYADEYVGYRRIGAWNLAKKTSPSGKRIEMMAVAAKETEGDFFLVMCAASAPTLYVSLVTKEPALTAEEPLRLKVHYQFDAAASDFEMQKVLVDDQAVLRSDDKADVEAMLSTVAKSQIMTITAGSMTRSYRLDGFAQAFEIVDGACRKSAVP